MGFLVQLHLPQLVLAFLVGRGLAVRVLIFQGLSILLFLGS